MKKTMIEFFSGSAVMSKTFKKAGYDIFTIDSNPDLKPDLCINILDFEISMLPKRFRKPFAIWASVPCTTFSLASIYHYWENGKPQTWKTYIGLALALKTVEIIKALNPTYYFIENPRAMLRKQHFMQRLPRKTVTYCQYGDKVQKPTDIFTNAPWIPKPICNKGDSCHESAVRGADRGTQAQNRDPYLRAILPQGLCDEIVAVCDGEVDKLQLSLTSPSFQATPSTQEG